MTALPATDDILVRKSITVKATPARAFAVFTAEMSTWWPLVTHHIGKADAARAVMEPFAGGRWFEVGVDGSECMWGHVRTWDPPHRLVLSWEISADWQPDASLQSEVEVRFTADGSGTRVDVEHRALSAFGARAREMQGVFDGDGGWSTLLAAFARQAS
jgi:uncharacterized protein YndB with AHSA1/START domain